ncbi:sWIM zinc finger domain protein [Brachyspira sp. CAG:484]|nr:sWIM zinc finger domain protein [Brachyspira sp. CAG:484]
MKKCEICGKLYDDSFDKCPHSHLFVSSNKNTANEIMNEKGVMYGCGGCLQVILAFICFLLGSKNEIFFGLLILLILTSCITWLIAAIKISEENEASNSKIKVLKQLSETSLDDETIKKYYLINAQNDDRRIERAKYETFSFKKLNTENKSADVLNQEKTKVYHTTLTSCTCPDFKERNVPCKHMYRLANELGYFSLYKEEERELIEKLWSIKDNHKLLTTLIDVFYRIRDKKDKYYVKTSPSLNKLAEFNLIKFKEIPEQELINIKYNTNELKGILHDKNFKNSITKKELIELFLSNKKLIKNLPKNMVHVTLTCTDKQKEYFTQTLNYFLYN